MRKICVVVTARATYGRIKTVLSAIQSHSQLELQLVVAASALSDKFGSVVNYIEKDGFDITSRISNLMETGHSTFAAKTTGLGIIELAGIFENIRPDVVVTVADRFETMATAIAAAYMNIPLVHIQGGEVTGNIDEKVRHAITKLADFHFVATAASRQRVIRLGESAERIFFTGCPSIDIAIKILNNKDLPFDPYEIYGGVGPKPDLSKRYLVVMQHPVTTESGSSKDQIDQTLAAILAMDIPTLWFWPNADHGTYETSHGIRVFREMNEHAPIHFFKNMTPEHFLVLLKQCSCLVGNSSVGIREGACLGVPVVNIGSRQNGREKGSNVIDCRPAANEITQSIWRQLNHGRYEPDFLYGKGNSGSRIADLLVEIPLLFDKKITY
ncbi:UDP-N-acetylglucosamine 2-epimerase [Dyadobacter sp. CY323]|uniref:UDP-N-acetylglucosamine 2-epimerase n=1 Tax=Dyadobacter sp. CY323 TaxID=2907302 RepID=UPI001F25F1EC|nr:UDP-N-acetylglucosamine 2-epimerase [Dyadobacter sp. CY323]MCE6988668.1 UDP-N-acetylglucosamine 2-epimerase [Dyadobacter sp. CY323]